MGAAAANDSGGSSARTPEEPADTENERTGLPGLPTWRAVYVLVIGTFILWVSLLLALSRVFA